MFECRKIAISVSLNVNDVLPECNPFEFNLTNTYTVPEHWWVHFVTNTTDTQFEVMIRP